MHASRIAHPRYRTSQGWIVPCVIALCVVLHAILPSYFMHLYSNGNHPNLLELIEVFWAFCIGGLIAELTMLGVWAALRTGFWIVRYFRVLISVVLGCMIAAASISSAPRNDFYGPPMELVAQLEALCSSVFILAWMFSMGFRCWSGIRLKLSNDVGPSKYRTTFSTHFLLEAMILCACAFIIERWIVLPNSGWSVGRVFKPSNLPLVIVAVCYSPVALIAILASLWQRGLARRENLLKWIIVGPLLILTLTLWGSAILFLLAPATSNGYSSLLIPGPIHREMPFSFLFVAKIFSLVFGTIYSGIVFGILLRWADYELTVSHPSTQSNNPQPPPTR